MKIRVKDLRGQHFNLLVQPAETLLQIKGKIKELKGIEVDKQKLAFKGKILQNEVILSEAGVKQDDHFVLLKHIEKKIREKQSNQQGVEENLKDKKKESSKQKDNNQPAADKNHLELLSKLGYDNKIVEQALRKNKNNISAAIEDLLEESKNKGKVLSANDLLRHEIIKNLSQNTQILDIKSGSVRFPDISKLTDLLKNRNQELKQLFLQDPHNSNPLELLLMGQGNGSEDEDANLQDFDDDGQIEEDEDQNGQEQYYTEINFTQQQQQTIQRLMNLGFTREQVIPAYLSCEKNYQLTANMLLNQLQNGDFDL